MPNPILNNYFIKQEHLLSAYKQLCNLCKNEQSYFVTIQPNKMIWSKEDASDYINELLPHRPAIVVLLEKNEQTKHKHKHKSYELLKNVHIHAYLLESEIKHLPNVVIYKDKYDLSNKKRALGVKQIHIVACKTFTHEPPTYLLKQSDNTHIPFKLNFKETILKPLVEVSKKMLPIYKKKDTPIMVANTHVYTYMQMLRFGTTFSQAIAIQKKDKQAKQRINALLNSSLVIDFLKRKKTSPIQRLSQLNKYVPFLPNAPTLIDKVVVYRLF